MMKKQAAEPARMTFEEATAELESILTRLEDGQSSLEETMKLFTRGKELAERCSALLDQAELRLTQLAGDADPAVGRDDERAPC